MGSRQHAVANREAGYLAGIQAAAEIGATGGSSQDLIKQVSGQLVDTLHLRSARYQPGVAGLGSPPRLGRDGQILWKGSVWDVERKGLLSRHRHRATRRERRPPARPLPAERRTQDVRTAERTPRRGDPGRPGRRGPGLSPTSGTVRPAPQTGDVP
nr:hypothetical protein GCM10020092_052520 [Actinoplanes digitatis]